MATDGRTKRSQSICAPASASMEALAAPETPAPRRRAAARSQSARLTGGRSVRQRRAQQQQQLDRSTRARYSSEPRLAEAETPPAVRRQASARRRPPQAAPRRSNAFLDVPRAAPPDEEPDEDSYRLRTFNITQKGGIVNRGDSFRRRRSRSGSLAPSSPAQSAPEPQERRPVACHRVAMVGAPGVGKTALISQFQTSECINAYDKERGGGPPKPKTEDAFYTRVLSLIQPSVVGLYNPYDNDAADSGIDCHNTESQPAEFQVPQFSEVAHVKVPDCNPVPVAVREPDGDKVAVIEVGSPVPDCTPVSVAVKQCDWGNYTPLLLQTPVSKNLRTDRKETNCTVKKTGISRRRPLLPTSSLDLLHNKKLEAIAIQREHADEERQEANSLHKIVMQIKEEELKIKKEELKQNILKSRLLLLELRQKKKMYKNNLS